MNCTHTHTRALQFGHKIKYASHALFIRTKYHWNSIKSLSCSLHFCVCCCCFFPNRVNKKMRLQNELKYLFAHLMIEANSCTRAFVRVWFFLFSRLYVCDFNYAYQTSSISVLKQTFMMRVRVSLFHTEVVEQKRREKWWNYLLNKNDGIRWCRLCICPHIGCDLRLHFYKTCNSQNFLQANRTMAGST